MEISRILDQSDLKYLELRCLIHKLEEEGKILIVNTKNILRIS